jgi:8-oxo-dGTP diphosphatase
MAYYTEAENRAYYKTQPTKHTGVMVAFFNPEGHVLIVKPNYKPGWNLVGGVIDANESPLHAAIRETEEEIGLTIAPDRLALLGVHYIPSGKFDDFLRILFSTQLTAAEASHLKIDPGELDGAKFVPLRELAAYDERPITPALAAILNSPSKIGYVEGTQLKGRPL